MRSPLPRIVALAALSLLACDEPRAAPDGTSRGYVLVSVDTLRADHLGAYGYERDTSPFFDELAGRGTLFERAFVQLPGTLPSHMSIFTGLYPAEHGVYPPAGVLAPEIATLPELLRAAGYRTAGFTEGGYMDGDYGFARGFGTFSDGSEGDPRAVERTFARGVEFLEGLEGDEPFFLFLHTYSVHDPYDPPAEYRELFWEDAAPDTFDPTGPNLVDVNRGRRPPPGDDALRYYVALYDAGIRYLDDVLRGFWRDLEERGLSESVTLIVTSDHGEEFLEHGMLVHEQVYRETLHVPLLIVGPGVGPARVSTLVESIDLAPTVLDLAGARRPESMSGRSLAHLLREPGRRHRDEAYAEAFATPTRSLLRQDDGALWHALVTGRPQSQGDFWVEREAVFDVLEPDVELRLHSYSVPREVEVAVDGAVVARLEVAPDGWTAWRGELGSGVHRVRLSTDGCISPAEIGASDDARCLGFKVSGSELHRRWELYRVDEDPFERRDLSRQEVERLRALAARLQDLRWEPLAESGGRELSGELRERLEDLGYLQ